jgi:penicillin-binding protein A
MASLVRWLGLGVAFGVVGALYPLVTKQPQPGAPAPIQEALSRIEALELIKPKAPPPNPFDGLDLLNVDLHPRGVTSPLPDGKTAHLTLDPELQRLTSSYLRRYQIPEAGAVLIDVKTGKVLVYSSYVNKGTPFDVNAKAEAPAASVFKVVTGAALVEKAGLNAATEQCYHGGKSAVSASELEDDPERDKWCASLASAMGRSLNVVFARLAKKHLSVEQLTETAGAFGFGMPVPFDVVNEPAGIRLPEEPVEFAKSAAGFWHTTLSPLAGAVMAQSVANAGVAFRPRIVERVTDASGAVTFEAEEEPSVIRRSVRQETATELTRMMVQTTLNGSGHRAFFDSRGRPFIPGVTVAGKTGTLSRHQENRHYTWFVGFAPADAPEVAVAALAVNTPTWKIKGPDLASEVLQGYFAKQKRRGLARK